MNFQPLTEEEIKTAQLAPEGNYNYRVVSSEEKKSRAGNEYISLMLEIWGEDGRNYIIFTGLFFHKLIKHFCDVNGLQNEYNSGTLAASSCLGKDSGKAVISIGPEKDDGKGGKWPPKNIVEDYIASPVGSQIMPLGASPFGTSGEFANEDIPF